MVMDLHPTLDDILDDFVREELVRVLHQAEALEDALKLHQARLKEVCNSIKAHSHWVNYGEHFPFTLYCRLCGATIPPEFDRRRHRGLCTLRECLSLAGRYASDW